MSDNPNFQPTLSSDDIWRDQDVTRCLSDDLDAIDADIALLKEASGTHALVNHTHTDKANVDHVHSEYAVLSHSHDNTYYTESEIDSKLNDKANVDHTHSGYAASNHNHDSSYAPIFTNDQGGVEYSYGSGSGKNVLTEISNMPQGFHTIYAIAGIAGNPRSNDSFRYLIHKTSDTIGWILAFDPQGSIYANYQSAANTFKGWRCIYEVSNKMILWSGASYLTSTDGTPQTVTPSKKLSECRTGWLLLWSDYDPGKGANDIDFATTMIPKYTPTGGKWGGKAFLCDIPAYVGGDPNDASTEKRIIKPIYVHDDCIKGSYQNTSAGRNDVVLRAVFEF